MGIRRVTRCETTCRFAIKCSSRAWPKSSTAGSDATPVAFTGTRSDWLRISTQHLLRTAGAVFEDGPGAVTVARHNLTWYPDAVWLYVLGCQWQRIAEEEAFAGRCAQVADDAGSAVVTARARARSRDAPRLPDRARYAWPDSKWLGTAFARLRCGQESLPDRQAALRERTGRRVNVR